MSDVLLSVTDLHAGYGRVAVLHGVSLEVRRGECVTIVGSNGSGKSTLLKSLVGLLRPAQGCIRLDGRVVTGTAPERLVRQGVALVPEGRLLFGPMTVAENLAMGAYAKRSDRTAVARARERVESLFPVLAERAAQPAETLSGGEQQMLAIGRALMSSPSLLLLDEPSLGLAPKVIAEIFSVLERLRAEGMTVLLVEQDAKLALRHSDRGYVMRTGRVALEGSSAELLANEDVRSIYLGSWSGEGSHA